MTSRAGKLMLREILLAQHFSQANQTSYNISHPRFTSWERSILHVSDDSVAINILPIDIFSCIFGHDLLLRIYVEFTVCSEDFTF